MYQEQLLPHSIEAEEAVLGAVLIDSGCLGRLVGKLVPEDFYREKNGVLWRTYLTLWRSKVVPDRVTVGRSLQVQGVSDTVGGMAYLSHLVAITPTSAHAEHYLMMIREASRLRAIIAQASALSDAAYYSSSSQEIVENGVRGLLSLRTGEEDRRPLSSSQLYDLYQADLLEELDADANYISGVTTGFIRLDRMVGGWKRGLFYIVGARTSIGKTTFAGACMTKLLGTGKSVFLFTLETSRKEMMERMWHAMARVDIMAYRALPKDSKEREDKREQLMDAMNDFDALPLTIDDRRGLTPTDMRATLMAHTQAFGPPALVVVDYLNLVKGESRRSAYEQVSETVKAMKDVGGEANVPMMVLAQLSRGLENRSDGARRPTLVDFRDAGTIEEVASCVIGLYRDSYYYKSEADWLKAHPTERYPKNTMEAHVLKQQSGPIGMVPLYCEMESGFMWDQSREDSDA